MSTEGVNAKLHAVCWLFSESREQEHNKITLQKVLSALRIA